MEYVYFMDAILFALYVWNLMMQCVVYAVLFQYCFISLLAS